MTKRPVSHHKIRFNKGYKSACLIVNINFGNLRGPATLIIKPDKIVIYVSFSKYVLLSSKIISIEKDSAVLKINHIDLNCPERILFANTSISNSGEEILSIIEDVGFSALGNLREKPDREKGVVRKGAGIIGGSIWLIVFTPHVLSEFGFSEIPWIARFMSIFPSFLKTESSLVFLFLSLSIISMAIRYSQPLQKMVLKQRVQIKEIAAQLDFLTVVSLVLFMNLLESSSNFYSFSNLFLVLGGLSIFFGHRLRAFIDEGI